MPSMDLTHQVYAIRAPCLFNSRWGLAGSVGTRPHPLVTLQTSTQSMPGAHT